jgi:DNA helicase-2/ATP-dependent DNA helicase PcrA
MQTLFEKAYKELNRSQQDAVNTIEGPVMVVAGPGTGKTQVLTLRIANILLKTQINPENILALTFSESASHQMRQRLLSIIGTPAYRVEISTFHSFANSIIQNYPEEFGNLISSQSISEDEQIEYLEKIIEGTDLKILRPWGDTFFYVKDILSAIGDLKKEGISPEKLSEVLKIQREDFKNIPDLYHEKGKFKGEMKGKYADEIKNMDKLKESVL